MNDKLIEQLSRLKMEESNLKRNIDKNYFNKPVRVELFKRLREVTNEINKVNFMLRLEKERKNAQNISD